MREAGVARLELTIHARDVLLERQIPEAFLWRTIEEPDAQESGSDGNVHYDKRIEERDGRVLHIVVNPNSDPSRIVTVFFDRRVRHRFGRTDATQG